MKKHRRCISCSDIIIKSAKTSAYLCRSCEEEYSDNKLDMMVPAYNKRMFRT